ncbi:phospholipase D family protein [Stenotrophomonas lactitubi]|uniref:phospholipase D family protein n=1 Tax=Stenotrophomonas lactitubi TaxID=2045214 RepID=UPI001310F481|nr:phospholipase D family protein [Stenotrophomonas lactitubi]MCX2894192.1 phospholipase D family protein [Stenotrophomonas lactitubi]
MELFLHQSKQKSQLGHRYTKAFREAVELYVVSAYLTEWDDALKISPECKRFRFIVGKDFGITRKDACRKVLRWLAPSRKAEFLVADGIRGFHPKSVIWKDLSGDAFMIIGSSNLSKAAFNSNVEANILVSISASEFNDVRAWIDWIEESSIPVSEDWLDLYTEAVRPPKIGSDENKASFADEAPTVVFKLPWPANAAERVQERQNQMKAFEKHKKGLMALFRRTAKGEIKNKEFYELLPSHWSFELGNRLQGRGWERLGMAADFKEIAQAFIAIEDASKRDRDDVVRREIDRLHDRANPARRAFLSEMLCLRFPDSYPVLNNPVRAFLVKHQLSAPRGSSEGSKYIDLAKKLRTALRANPSYIAKNLAELDLLIWDSSEYNPQG